MKRCIISVADGKYVSGLDRLEKSIQASGFKGDALLWRNELPPGSPSHDEAPCSFKIFAFLEAKKRGYESALWIDATGIVVRDTEPIFEQIEKEGYFLLGNFSSSVGEWSSDLTLKQFGIEREEAMKIPELLTFAIGLDFKSNLALDFLEKYRQKALDGISFRGAPSSTQVKDTLHNQNHTVSEDSRVKGHRWEQTVASLIAHDLKMKHSLYGSFDLIGHATNGKKYARYIPLDAQLVQNRDIKEGIFLPSVDKWNGRKGVAAKLEYFLVVVFMTPVRRLKNVLRIVMQHRFPLSYLRIFR